MVANKFHYFRGGSEKVYFDEIELLRKYEHLVIPFSMKNKKNISSKYNNYFANQLHYENPKSLKNKIKSFFEIIYSIESKKKVDYLIKKFKPEIIHGHNIYGLLTTSIIDSAKKNNLPFLMTIHDYKIICPNYKLYNGEICEKCEGKKFYNALIKKCVQNKFMPSLIYTIENLFNLILKKYEKIDYLISPSKFLMNKFIQFGFDPEKITYIPNFIQIDNYNSFYGHNNYFLYFGRIASEKGIRTLINAYERLNEKKYKLIIAGDGPLLKKEMEYIKGKDISNIKFLGYISGRVLEDAIRKATCIIVPSEWYENCPMTILEAFAYGKPVIGSNIGGISELISEAEDGYLFEPKNVDDLANKMEIIIRLQPRIIIEMGKKGREKTRKIFNPDLHYSNLISIYKEALINY